MMVIGECIIGGRSGITLYWCKSTSAHVKKLLFEDYDGAKFEMTIDNGDFVEQYSGPIISKHWRGAEDCDCYIGKIDVGDGLEMFCFKAFPTKKKFSYMLGEFIEEREFKADYVDYKKLIGKDIIGDHTYTDDHRM